MSKIRDELAKAADVTPKRGEDDGAYLKRLVAAVGELADDDWDKLSDPAQDWFNDAADAVNKKKELPAFPDAEQPAAEEKPTRRRGAAKEEAEEKPEAPSKQDTAIDVGDEVTAVTKRGKTYTGKVVEIDDSVVVIDTGDAEEELNRDRLESLDKVAKEKPTSTRRKAAEEPEDDGPVEPKVGDTVKVVTSRDKVVEGKLVEFDDDIVVVDDGKDEQEFKRDRIKSVTVVGGKAPKKEAEEKPAARGRGAAKEEAEEKPAEKRGRATAAANGGVSVTQRIRELIADDTDASKDDIAKQLKAEKLDFRDNTLDLTYADAHKMVKLLRERKKLK